MTVVPDGETDHVPNYQNGTVTPIDAAPSYRGHQTLEMEPLSAGPQAHAQQESQQQAEHVQEAQQQQATQRTQEAQPAARQAEHQGAER